MKKVLLLLSFLSLWASATELPEELRDLGVKFRMLKAKEDCLSPLLREGKIAKISHDTDAIIYDRSLREVLLAMQARSAEHEVVLDCSFFVQIVGKLLSGDMDKSPSFLVMSPLTPTEMAIIFTAGMAYVTVADPAAYVLLMETNLLSKGQWLIKIAPGQYLGLVGAGPRIDSAANWLANTRQDLFREIDAAIASKAELPMPNPWSKHTCEAISEAEAFYFSSAIMADILRIRGRLERWTLHSSPDFLQRME